MDTSPDEFDFDTWAELARTDPDEFERRRRALLMRRIDAMPERMAATKEALRRSLLEAPKPGEPALTRAVEAFNVMQESVRQLTDAYGALARSLPEGSAQATVALTAAQRFTRLTVL